LLVLQESYVAWWAKHKKIDAPRVGKHFHLIWAHCNKVTKAAPRCGQSAVPSLLHAAGREFCFSAVLQSASYKGVKDGETLFMCNGIEDEERYEKSKLEIKNGDVQKGTRNFLKSINTLFISIQGAHFYKKLYSCLSQENVYSFGMQSIELANKVNELGLTPDLVNYRSNILSIQIFS
jgi:hypothetical protein